MPHKICLEAGCPNFADEAKYRGRCKAHYLERNRERMAARRADPDKGKRLSLYRSKRWLVLRRTVVFEQPICAIKDCNKLSTDVDHITPLSQGGAMWDRENLQGLCAWHHSLKSGEESIAAREGGFPDAA